MAALEAACPDGARFVGGCVRNALLGRPIDDIDIATKLLPEDTVKALNRAGIKAIPTGIEHGTITAVCNSEPFEITTLRKDVETDGRRAVVAFTSDWAEDAQRRDFRLNALYCDMTGEIYDPTGGLGDIASRRVVFIGDAEQRLREDHLRNLRFFRFTAWYADEMDQTGLNACTALREGLEQIAAERIWKEFLKLLTAPSPFDVVDDMAKAGVLDQILPKHEGTDRFTSLGSVETRTEQQFDGFHRFLMLVPKSLEAVCKISDRLRQSRREKERLMDWAKADVCVDDLATAKKRAEWFYRHGNETVRDVLIWHWSGEPGEGVWQEALSEFKNWKRPVFPIKGSDLLARGASPGPGLGQKLREIESAWIANGFEMDGVNWEARL